MSYYVEILRRGTSYEGSISMDYPAPSTIQLSDLKLGPHETVSIRGISRSLQELISDLINADPNAIKSDFDERWQLEIGQYLFDRVLKNVDIGMRERDGDDWGDIRIVTHDEHAARLPWSLLFNNGVFLSAARWAVSLSTKVQCPDYELPPSPRILIVVPQPAGYATHAESHVEVLEELLSGADRLLRRGRNMRVVATWEDFKISLSEFSPHIVYYYGHGVGDLYSSRLVFETGAEGAINKPIADVANILQTYPEQVPLLVYLNCCLGDAGGLLGAGRQLGGFIPAVITNYGLASVSTAQAQALAIWRSILLDAAPPARGRGEDAAQPRAFRSEFQRYALDDSCLALPLRQVEGEPSEA